MAKKCAECGKINSIVTRSNKSKCQSCGSHEIPIEVNDVDVGVEIENDELVKQNVKLATKNLRLQTINTYERRIWRNPTKETIFLQDYVTCFSDLLKERAFSPMKKHLSCDSPTSMIVHLTDTHFNELVDLGENGNKYDFRIASKRLFRFASKIIQYANSMNVKNVKLAMTGDLINSDRRTDEIISLATNRTKASYLAMDLLSMFIRHLNEHVNVEVYTVSGNESRVREESSNSDFFASDNYDFGIFQGLKMLFMHNDGVTFVEGNPLEQILTINGVNFLLCHGNFLKKQIAKDINGTLARYIRQRNIRVDYILCGHLHEAKIKDVLLRSGSLVGANDYSDKALNLISRASQNIHFIFENGDVDSMKIDLQNVDDDSVMYDVDPKLEEYNAKSIIKVKRQRNSIIYKALIERTS